MAKWRMATAWTMGATMLALGAAACGSDISASNEPAVEVTIDGQHQTSKEFLPDETGGQLTDLSVVRVRNTGSQLEPNAPPPVLEIKAIEFVTDNPYLKMKFPKGTPTFPIKLDMNGSLEIQVIWAPDPNDENNSPAQMIIKHNVEGKADLKLTFKVAEVGARIALDATELVWTNPSAAVPQKNCVTFRNTGNAKLVFKGAVIASAKPYYTVVKTPDQGESIDPIGVGDNPKGTPKKLEVCVRLEPAGKDKDYDDDLQIETSDKSNSKVKVKLKAVFTQPAVYDIKCDEPTGAILYNFQGVGPGNSGVGSCSVYNEGPGGFVIQSLAIKALEVADQTAAEEMYEIKLYKVNTVTGEKEYSDPTQTVAIGEGKTRYFEVIFTHPNDGSAVAANLVVNFTQANVSDTIEIPISAGKCDTPQAVFAPATAPVWVKATLDKPGKAKVVLANQSCAPLQIIKLCTTQKSMGGVGVDPCQNATLASAHFKITSGDGLATVLPWDLYTVDVELAPPDEQYPHLNHQLNVRYCPGLYANTKCTDGDGKAVALQTQVINLIGFVESKATSSPIELPGLKLAPVVEGDAKVGQPYKIEAGASDGTWPIGEYGAYLWMLTKRPKGSKTWLGTGVQTSNDPWVTIKPDMVGEYAMVGVVQSVDGSNAANIAWSEQVTLTFKAVAP